MNPVSVAGYRLDFPYPLPLTQPVFLVSLLVKVKSRIADTHFRLSAGTKLIEKLLSI
jgi:hypothetical protein